MANTKGKSNTKYHRSKTRRDKIKSSDDKDKVRAAEYDNSTLNKNDPAWYLRDPVMKEGLTRLPTFEFRGVDTKVSTSNLWIDSGIPNLPTQYLTSPTVAVHKLNPSPGTAENTNSPINMAARMLYSKLSSSNAKTSNYAPQDVATLMLAIGEIISTISYLTRAYGITQFYNKLNRAIPDAMLKAHNIAIANVATWTQELPQFRAELNQLITVANSITFPSNIPYFKKCAYVYQHIYIDDYSAMTGYHMMAPQSTWKVDETSYEQGTILKTVTVGDSSPKVVLGRLREMINAILTSTTYNYIYSDILNLATRGVLGADLLSFGTIPIDYVVEPINSDQFNWQLMNATIFGEPNGSLEISGRVINTTPNNDVYPDVNSNCLIFKPRWTGSSQTWYGLANMLEPIVRTPDVGVSEDDIIELVAYTGTTVVEVTRPSAKSDVLEVMEHIGTEAIGIGSIPDHYFVSSSIYYGQTSDDRAPVKMFRNNIANAANPNAGTSTLISSLASEFQHFPLTYYWTGYNETDNIRIPANLRFTCRLGSYTLGMIKAIKNIRDASYIGLFTME